MARTPHARPRRKTLADQDQGNTHRLEIAVPTADLEALREVAIVTGETTLTAVLRDALKVYMWIILQQRRKRLIIAEDQVSGARTELMPLLRVTELSAAHQESA